MKGFLTQTQWRRLLGFRKGDPIYRCVHCHQEAREGTFEGIEAATAILQKITGDSMADFLTCRLCEKHLAVSLEKRCGECGHSVISAETDYFGVCCFCGFETSDDDIR